jgi:hypothetical protein
LTSDQFDALLPLHYGTNLTFQEKILLASRNQTANLAESSEATVKRNSLRKLKFKSSAQIRGLLQI